jgi:hypothetical protein
VIRGIRSCLQSGQATVELAVIGPLLVGLFALTLQGGLVISDQVNLQHFAYEGAQWAVTNRTTATVASVTSHIQDQICGNGKAVGASDGLTRLCSDGGLSINVSVGAATASTQERAGWGSALGLVDAQAAVPTCPRDGWDLVVTPASGNGAAGVTITAKLTGPAGTGVPGSTYPPVVDLSTLGMPLGTSAGTPLWNPPTLSGSGVTSTMYIQTTSHTPAGTYNLKVTGTDQCGGQPANGPKTVSIGTSSGAAPVVDSVPHIDGVTPSCVRLGVPTTLTINGQNFVSGATVAFDLSGVSYPTTFISARQVTVAVTATTADTDNIVLTNPNPPGTQAKIFGAVVNAASCPGGTGNIAGSSTACSAGATAGYAVGNGVEYMVTIAWNEHLIIPWITSTVGLSATEHAFCQ